MICKELQTKQLKNYQQWLDDKDVDFERQMPVNTTVEELSDEDFIEIAEEQGLVYTLNGFTQAFNNENINSSTDIIRFIEVEV